MSGKTGTPFDFNNWHTGQPNSYNGNKDCVVMNYGNYAKSSWNEYGYTGEFGFVCKI